MARSRPFIKNQQTAFWLGIGLYLAGTWCLWDAHEHRGKNRPFALRWLPGA
jgi:hypothetical protein